MERVIKDDIRIINNETLLNRRYHLRLDRYVGSDVLNRDDLKYTIAGGFLNSVDNRRAIQDIDIYPNDEDTSQKLIATLSNHGWATKNNKTFVLNGKKIQILDIYNEPSDILVGFDFIICMKGWQPQTGKIYKHKYHDRDLRDRKIIYNLNSEYPIKNIIHLTKYIRYGYKIGPLDLMAILFKINNLNLQNEKVFKQQLMYYESQPLLDDYINLFKELCGPTKEKMERLSKIGFNKQVERISMGKCATCSQQIAHADFRDELSRKEFGISGMCQKCQDEVFGDGF